MQENLQKLAVWIDNLSFRERVLFFGLMLIIIYALWAIVLLSPLQQRRETLQARTEVALQKASLLKEQAQAIINDAAKSPNINLQRKQAKLQKRLSILQTRLQALNSKSVSAVQMGKMLQDLLSQVEGLHLVRLDSQLPKAQDQATPEEADFQPHQLVLEFRGDYWQVLAYLQKIEALKWWIIWDELDYQVVNYPQAKIVIKLGTYA